MKDDWKLQIVMTIGILIVGIFLWGYVFGDYRSGLSDRFQSAGSGYTKPCFDGDGFSWEENFFFACKEFKNIYFFRTFRFLCFDCD